MANLEGMVDPRHFEINEAATVKGLTYVSKEVKLVEVEEEFYKKLIFTASQTFIHTGFNFIKSTLIGRLEDAKDVQQLLVAAKEFVETREFVDKVVAEQDRLDSEARQQDKP